MGKSTTERDPYGTVTLFSVTLPIPIAFAYLLSVLYNVTFFMQFFTTPYLLKSLGISDTENGYVQTLFGLLQMCGSPFFGYIVQRFGVRMSLFICYGSTMLSGVLLFFSNDLSTVFLSRIPCIFMHGQQGHQTLLSALTSPGKERTNAFGRMGLTFGLGFVITPIFCIIFTKLFSESAPIIASAVFCVLPFLVLECCLDRRSYEEHQSEVAIESETNMSITNVVRILNRPGVLNVMFKKNAPIVPMLLIFSIMHTISFVMFFFFYRLWMIIIIMPFISFGMSLVATVADSLLTALVAENEQGLVLGVATSFNSFVRVFAPTISGYMLETFGFSSFALIGSLSTAIGHLIIFMFPLNENLLRKRKTD
ncbi:transporter, major facilitator family protein [Necator americanus]|uniref:Transporter, major facilitator family protein n=1 Tax=Necator americanus TaxID=51031 RepID=W2TWP8_NECAM|nr:transporter, major facilitator family protein [Necator americanus]ETN85442.1 transporter, major facilitator family protein [Necator americanus]